MNIKDFLKSEKSEVLRYMGYANQTLTPELDIMTDNIITECETLAQPKFVYGYFDTEFISDGIALANTDVVLKGEDIIEHLRGSSYCAVMAITIGIEPEKRLTTLEKLWTMRQMHMQRVLLIMWKILLPLRLKKKVCL